MSSSSVEQCALCADSTHDVHHAIVEVNVVIGVLVVHCELLVVRVVPLIVCDDAVVRRTLVLIAVAVGFVFVVAIFHRILLYWRYIVYKGRRMKVLMACWEVLGMSLPESNGRVVWSSGFDVKPAENVRWP